MKYSISPQSFNAVMACAATNDVRYYLNSFFIDHTAKCIVATNGHVMAKAPLGVLDEDGAVPHKHEKLYGWLFEGLRKPISNKGGDHIIIDTDKRMLTYWTNREQRNVGLVFVDGTFPDYLSVEAKYTDSRKAIDEIAFNPEYVSKPLRWAGVDGGAHFLFGERGKMYVTYQREIHGVEMTLMPTRI